MKIKKEIKILSIILNSLIFIFFIGFVYFSYFTAKELLVLKYIDSNNYSAKFYSWELQECDNLYSYKNDYYNEYNLVKENITEQEKSIIKNKCYENLYKKSEIKKLADFKYNFIKYGLATCFFFIIFIFFAIQNYYFYRKYFK